MWLFINGLKNIVWMPLIGCLHKYRKFRGIYSVRIFVPQSFAQEIAHNRSETAADRRSDRCTESTRIVIDWLCGKSWLPPCPVFEGHAWLCCTSNGRTPSSPATTITIAFGTRKWQACERDRISAEEGREPTESLAIEHNPFESRNHNPFETYFRMTTTIPSGARFKRIIKPIHPCSTAENRTAATMPTERRELFAIHESERHAKACICIWGNNLKRISCV